MHSEIATLKESLDAAQLRLDQSPDFTTHAMDRARWNAEAIKAIEELKLLAVTLGQTELCDQFLKTVLANQRDIIEQEASRT